MGTQMAFPRTYTIPGNIPRQENLDENKTKGAFRSHLFRPGLRVIEAHLHEPSSITRLHLLET